MKISLKDRGWREYKIGDIFNIDKGVYLHKKNIIKGEIPYITAKSVFNGVSGFVGNRALFKGNCITIEKMVLSKIFIINQRSLLKSQLCCKAIKLLPN